MDTYITIAHYTFTHEYAVLKLILQQEHIRFFFQNETMIGVLPFSSNALGGIALKVHPADILQAKEILDNFNFNTNLTVV
ncbi:hypothetical protein GCM10009117_18760 [Gangjinia marincola]|uniref:DUF2007 domain-containing protein n=1 Tax=Gangjinia marincola TaxID=578463 RepID=A0ABP3XWI9_9FLAO